MTARTPSTLLALALGLLLAAPAAAAPPGPADDRGPTDAQIARHKARRGQVLRTKLGLDDARAQRVEALLDKQRASMKAVKQEQRKLMKRLHSLLEADSADQQAYSDIVKALRYNHDRLHQLKQGRIDALAKELTPKQQAQALMILQRHKRHKRGQRGMRGGQGRRGGGFGGGPMAPPPGE